MKPYYENAAITIYHADCREVLPQLDQIDLILTDPPLTRRLRGLEKLNSGYYKDRIAKVEYRDGLWCFWEIGGGSSALSVFTIKCPYGGKGDRLWVKETWQSAAEMNVCHDSDDYPIYRATDPDWGTVGGWRWKPSIFMPRRASRITLEITEVKVERLRETSEEDAMAEGVDWKDYAGLASKTAKKLYAQLWDSINIKTFPWSSNPWVFVISFKRV